MLLFEFLTEGHSVLPPLVLFGVPRPVRSGVSWPGGGNAASISDKPDWRTSFFSGAPVSQKSMPSRLAVRPRSRLDASRVALRIRSGKLVRLPRASASRTASMSSLGGRRAPARSASVIGRSSCESGDEVLPAAILFLNVCSVLRESDEDSLLKGDLDLEE